MQRRDATSYRALAPYYDRLMTHVDYAAWVSFALDRLGLPRRVRKASAERRKAPLVLDLACGTGTIAVELARRGYRVIGLDLSEEMLAVADAKARQAGVEVFFTRQDLRSFRLPEKADAAVCLFDSLNYLTSPEDLEKAFRRVAAALAAGAPFLFDLHTEYRLRWYGETTFAYRGDDIAYIWESEYDPEKRLCTMELTLFVRQPDGRYARFEEVHEERAHTSGEVESALRRAGLELVGVYGELSCEPPRPDEGRVFYLVRRGA